MGGAAPPCEKTSSTSIGAYMQKTLLSVLLPPVHDHNSGSKANANAALAAQTVTATFSAACAYHWK